MSAPEATELERAVLGAALFFVDVVPDVADFLAPRMFYDPANAMVWAAILDLYRKRDPIDSLTVTMRLKQAGHLVACGGPIYIAQLTNGVGGTGSVQYHARIIMQHWISREATRIGEALMRRANDHTSDPFDVLTEASAEIRLLNEHSAGTERTMAEIMPEVIDNNGPDRGIPFGYPDIDKMMRAEPGTVTIIGARPGMGKTAFMLSSAKRQAWMGHRPYIAEMEMRDKNLATRLACGECSIPVWRAKRKLMDQHDQAKLSTWFVDHGDHLGRMVINETASMNTASLAARLDRHKRKSGIDVVWIDYIGLMQPNEKQKDAYHRMTKISNELRVLAKDLDLPFIVLAQLSRPAKGSSVSAPKLTDLRDSGEVEQDAEAVAFLHRPAYYDRNADDTVEFIVAKNRDGQDGFAELWFDGPGVRILDKSNFPTPFPTTRPNDNEEPF